MRIGFPHYAGYLYRPIEITKIAKKEIIITTQSLTKCSQKRNVGNISRRPDKMRSAFTAPLFRIVIETCFKFVVC